MIKQFIIKYKLFTMPFYYEFKVYAENTESACNAFFKEYPIGIERFYIATTIDI